MSGRTSTTTVSKPRRVQAARAAARSDVYLFLARAFAYPQGSLTELHDSARRAAGVLGGDSLEMICRLEIPLQEALETEYIRAFGHTVKEECPAYEMEYRQGHLFMQSQSMAELAAFYRAFGVEASSGERLDHVGTELEFMYFLAFREAVDLLSGSKEGAEICRDGQRRFLEKHLGCWSPLFLSRVGQQVEGMYRRLAEAALAWLDVEAEELGAHPSPLGEEVLAGGSRDALSNLSQGPSPCDDCDEVEL